MDNGTVYIANHAGSNYDDAKRFGDLVYMSRGSYQQDELDHILEKIKNYIKDSYPTDYLILDGARLLCSYAFSVWQVKHGFVNLLQWNPSFGKRCYEEKRVDL